MNAMGVDTLPPMVDGIKEVMADPEVRVVVLRGDGGNFSTGADLSIMGEKMDPEFLNFHMLRMNEAVHALHEGPKPVIAEVDGWAVGGGFGLALAADITYATERALFMMSFVRISIIPDLGCVYLLTRRVGLHLAKELALTGRVVDAQEALRIGLVNRVMPHQDISGEVMKTAAKMAGRSPEVLAAIKRHINAAPRLDLATLQELEAYAQPFFVLKPEHRADIARFFEKG
jgi:2-(1,2-epoxy-1,2-dihydrophenyl)acetyl-CoA isomerase